MATHPDEHHYLLTPDHEERARALLYWQWQQSPRLVAFVEALGQGAQQLEHTLWAALVGTSTLQGAEGVHLDRWGLLVGEERGGLSTEEYRRFIELRILANKAFPDEDLLWTLLDGATPPEATVLVHRLYPAALKAIIYGYDWLPDAVATHTAALVRDARPGAIMWVVIETLPGRFAFDWEPDCPLFPSLGDLRALPFSHLVYSGRGPR